jgi:dnd system-associated protein 4
VADKDQFSRPLEHEDFVKLAVRDGGGPFPTMRDLFLFAASIGIREGKRKKTQEEKKTVNLERRVFDNTGVGAVVFPVCGLYDFPDDLEIVLPNKFGIQSGIFVEFANTGFEILKRRLGKNNPQQLVSVIEDLLDEYKLLD